MSELKNSVYEIIRDRLIIGPLEPGRRVSETALSRELGTSRAPVREAIQRLVMEGLVQRIPEAGTFVAKPSRVDLEDVYKLREWLECNAAADAALHISPQQIAELERAINESRDVARQARAIQHDEETASKLLYRGIMAELSFHTTLARASGNSRVVKLVHDNCLISQLWEFRPEREEILAVPSAMLDHWRILRRVRRGDAAGAAEAMRRHLRSGVPRVLAQFDAYQRRSAMRSGRTYAERPRIWHEVQRMVRVAEGDSEDPSGGNGH